MFYNDLANFSKVGHVHDWSSISNRPSVFTPAFHNHNDLYYTESEIVNLLNKYSLNTHNHDSIYTPISLFVTEDPGENIEVTYPENTLICVYEEVTS